MSEFVFHVGVAPEGLEPVFEQTIFNFTNHRILQSSGGWRSFFIINPEQKALHGAIHFHLNGDVAKSPLRSPFGSFELSSAIDESVFGEFVAFIEKQLKNAGIQTVVIKNPPDIYFPRQAALINSTLSNIGYAASAEVTSVIEVSNEKSFESQLHSRNQQNLRQSRKSEFHFQVLTHDRLIEVYNFIKARRDEKNYGISMTFTELQVVLKEFPDNYILSGVFRNSNLAAASISVRVHSKILYLYLGEHLPKVDQSSPGLLMMEGLYYYCQRNDIRCLDVGTSNPNGVSNAGLMSYKASLGAVPSDKLTFKKEL